MIEGAAYQGLGIGARRVLDFLMVEHMSHAGTENGRLLAPYNQLAKFGVARSEILDAINELVAFGFVEVSRGERQGGKAKASRYWLTWLPTADGKPASDKWKKTTEATVLAHHAERKRMRVLKKARKAERRQSMSAKERVELEKRRERCRNNRRGTAEQAATQTTSSTTEILEAVRKTEPSLVRKVEPRNGLNGSKTRTEMVRKVGVDNDF